MSSESSYYVPASSKLPIFMALSLLLFVYGAGYTINDLGKEDSYSHWILISSFLLMWGTMFFWFSEVIKENDAGMYSDQLNTSFVHGMSWFIFSEVMFFFAFFLALGYVRIFAVPWLGGEGEKGITNILWPGFEASWPLMETPDNERFPGAHHNMSIPPITQIHTWLPFWNTLCLVTSSGTIALAEAALKKGNRKSFKAWMVATISLGYIFVVLQSVEYYEAYAHMGLTLGAGIYGTTFFLMTGFHGFHVCLGAIILTIMTIRGFQGAFSEHDHFGLAAGSWYWHFVDVVWILLVLVVYIF
ncbi:cytochrome c oxidase subunit 3 [SAR86 cluster bacterium]|jgi:cytochrome c oxidase subunit 3|nr:cytochrome c oxidase subunit 3 [SAR86 cluster bacterium]